MFGSDLCEVAEQGGKVLPFLPAVIPVHGDRAVTLFQNSTGKGLDFGKASRGPAQRVPGDSRSFDPGTNGQIAH
jgi:hypothetical protein